MDMRHHHYVFRSVWRLPADRATVYAALVDVAAYPSWWPQVRQARQLDEQSGELYCRSLLPYGLRFVASREIQDEPSGVLRAGLTGDLVGYTQWTISANGTGALAVFDEDVVVGTAKLRAASRVIRPVLRYNHHLMMRAGEAGLRRLLGG